MTILELSIILGFVATLIAIGISYGATSNQVKNLTIRQNKDDESQIVRDRDNRDWQRGEVGRIRDSSSHEELDECKEQFLSINNKLSNIEGQLDALTKIFNNKKS